MRKRRRRPLAVWFFYKTDDGIEMQARVTGAGGTVGDMRSFVPKGWEGLGTSYEELAASPSGIALDEGNKLRILSDAEAREMGIV
jgi:hypothetical protein